ncbi:hypothetical protein TNCV_893461 [Trichonephila clavipes]|nr:hypothetical protein TNCV_893461 [Trichonephila clavipes]
MESDSKTTSVLLGSLWSTEYLHSLQPRSKWWRTKPNLQLGDMVIVEKEQTVPLNWTLGRINKLFFGPDQKPRVRGRFTSMLLKRFSPRLRLMCRKRWKSLGARSVLYSDWSKTFQPKDSD